jgi:hypothetical protein
MKTGLYSLSLAIVFFAFSACESPKKTDEYTEDESDTTEVADAILTPEQKAEGWKVLFNGRNLNGWKIFKSKENNSWEVTDGMLHCKPFDDADKRADIMTTEQYDNFELSFDWKISAQGNSGVMFRVTEDNDEPYQSGPEYQIIDDVEYPGDLKDTQYTGSNYDMHPAPEDKPVNPVGEWNTSKIVANGNHIEHWLNGKLIIEYEIGSEEWLKLKENSKWNDAEGYGISKSGYIDFQDHGNEVWFKNILIKTL